MSARRAAAFERFSASPLPTDADEIWRYSRISELDLAAFSPVPPSAPGSSGVPGMLEGVLAAVGATAGVVVVHNGSVVHRQLDAELAGRGVVLSDLSELPDGDGLLGSVAPSGTDPFTELNTALVTGAVVLRVPGSVVVERPIVVLHFCDAPDSALFPRTIVDAADDSEVTVLEYQASADVASWIDPVVELSVGAAARVRYLNVQQLGPRVWQTGYHASRVGRDGTLRSAVVALGGEYARVRTDSRLEGKGGTSELRAVYFGDRTQMHDFRTVQDHAAPSTTSDLLFKGAVEDTAASVYSGLIRVRKEAEGTNAFQTNRNLVLSEGARAESVPNLEIETNDVRCSHASAVGPIDPEQRYYLESRGVPPALAERLIVLGFFSEVLERLPVPELIQPLRAAMASKLEGGSA